MRIERPALMLATALALLASPVLARPTTAPRVGVASFEALPKPLPLPYDEKADADRAVNAALARARASRKLLLVDLGGNWCLDCRLLAGTMDLPKLAPWVRRNYELVAVDVGRFDKNMQIPARFGKPQLRGVPALLVVDPKTGKLRNSGREEALADARSMTPQALADWLAQWVR